MEMTPRDQHWYDLICQCRKSGLTDKQWCLEHNVQLSTFYRHVRKLKNLSCEIPAVGHKGQMQQAGRQDMVPLQIIQESPGREQDASHSSIALPETLHLERIDHAHSEEPKEDCMPVLQVHFPNGISLNISNDVSPSILHCSISSLAEP